jgi:hypothetical protein
LSQSTLNALDSAGEVMTDDSKRCGAASAVLMRYGSATSASSLEADALGERQWILDQVLQALLPTDEDYQHVVNDLTDQELKWSQGRKPQQDEHKWSDEQSAAASAAVSLTAPAAAHVSTTVLSEVLQWWPYVCDDWKGLQWLLSQIVLLLAATPERHAVWLKVFGEVHKGARVWDNGCFPTNIT